MSEVCGNQLANRDSPLSRSCGVTLPSSFRKIAALAATVSSVESEVARLQAESSSKPFNYTENEPSWLLQAAIHAHCMGRIRFKIENYRH
jgi:hypothetical protein